MTPTERLALQRLNRRAAQLSPELVVALLKAMRLLRDRVPVAEVERLLRLGRLSEALDAAVPIEAIERALIPATRVLTEGALRTARATVPTMPAAVRTLGVDFTTLNPRVLDAIRGLNTTQILGLRDEVREVVRGAIEQGLARGVNPRTAARTLTDTIGLAPNQRAAVEHFRAALESGDFAKARGYALRDSRFDRALRGELAPARIDTMVAAYERRMRAFNAETHARTAALEAQKVGQQLAWHEAKASGALGEAEVIAVWVTTLDGRERDEHREMNRSERPLDGTYSNGQAYPGEGEYNCRCTEIFRVARPSFALAA